MIYRNLAKALLGVLLTKAAVIGSYYLYQQAMKDEDFEDDKEDKKVTSLKLVEVPEKQSREEKQDSPKLADKPVAKKVATKSTKKVAAKSTNEEKVKPARKAVAKKTSAPKTEKAPKTARKAPAKKSVDKAQ